MRPNTSTSPWHRHSAFSPGRLVTYRMFEWGNVTTRQWPSTSSPAMRAFATPKSICATPGAQTSSPYPSEPLRFASRQRLTYLSVVVYSPSWPVSARSLSCTRLAVRRCLRGSMRSASSHSSTNAAYGSILEPRRLSMGGFGVMSSISAYFATVARSTSGLLAISDLDTP